MESGILGRKIRNLAQGIRNLESGIQVPLTSNLESKLQDCLWFIFNTWAICPKHAEVIVYGKTIKMVFNF